MILVLKGADFSANNIGKVSLSVDDRTKAIMDKYGRTYSSEQAVAIQDFMTGLESNGILTKLRALYMPVLGTGLGNAFVNIASSGYVTDSATNTDGIVFEDGAVKNSGTNGTSGTNILSVTRTTADDVTRNNLFLAMYGVPYGTGKSYSQCVMNNLYSLIYSNGTPVIGNTYIKAPYYKASADSGGMIGVIFTSGASAVYGINYRESDMVQNKLMMYDSVGVKLQPVNYYNNTTEIAYSNLPTDSVGTTIKIGANTSNLGGVKLIAMGQSLSEEQAIAFRTLVNGLMEKF